MDWELTHKKFPTQMDDGPATTEEFQRQVKSVQKKKIIKEEIQWKHALNLPESMELDCVRLSQRHTQQKSSVSCVLHFSTLFKFRARCNFCGGSRPKRQLSKVHGTKLAQNYTRSVGVYWRRPDQIENQLIFQFKSNAFVCEPNGRSVGGDEGR